LTRLSGDIRIANADMSNVKQLIKVVAENRRVSTEG